MPHRKEHSESVETFPTRIDLPLEKREKMIGILNQLLADVTDLYSQAKQAHWNVKGPEFFQLHKLFDDLAEGLLTHIDAIAERVTALGGIASGTVRMAAAATHLPEYTPDIVDGLASVKALAVRFAQAAEGTRAAVTVSDEDQDLATTDLLSQATLDLDKALWFLEAHLQEKP